MRVCTHVRVKVRVQAQIIPKSHQDERTTHQVNNVFINFVNSL